MMALAKKNPGSERTLGTKLAVLVKRANGVPMEEALQRADEAGLVIASNKRIERAIMERKERRSILDAFPLWTGTLVAYDEPGQRLGKTFEYTEARTGNRYVLDVPEEHQGRANVVLVAEHPDFTIEKDGMNRIIHAKRLGILARVPTILGGGWYHGDHVHAIPCGKKVDKNSESARILGAGYRGIRLVVRGDDSFQGLITFCTVSLNYRPSDRFGVVVEGTPEQISAAARLIEQMKVK